MRSMSGECASCWKASGPWKSSFWVEGRLVEAGVELIEVGARGGELVGEEVGESDDAGAGVLREGARDGGAAVAAAEQAEAHGGVCGIAEGGCGFEQKQAGGSSGGLEQVASVHQVLG